MWPMGLLFMQYAGIIIDYISLFTAVNVVAREPFVLFLINIDLTV